MFSVPNFLGAPDIINNPLSNILAGIQAQQQFATNQAKTKAETGKTEAETQFMPVERATQLANAMRLNNRFGTAYQTKAWLQSLPQSQRDLWIASHKDEYGQMMQDILQDQQQQKVLSQFLTSVAQGAFKNTNDNNNQLNPILSKILSSTTNQQQPNNNLPIPFGLNQLNANQQPQINPVSQQAVNQIPQQPSTVAPGSNYAPDELTQYHEANRSATQPQTKNSAESGAQMEKFLMDNREKVQRVANEIKQYNNYLGKGKEWVDAKLKKDSSQAYRDLKWFKESFLPALVNRLGYTENASINPAAREGIKNMIDTFGRTDLDPESAINVFNDKVNTLFDVADASFNAAEPYHKGTYRQLYQIPRLDGPYITYEKNDVGTKAFQKSLAEGQSKQKGIAILYKNGTEYRIPANLQKKALQNGFTLNPD